jgi:hypothetical protein
MRNYIKWIRYSISITIVIIIIISVFNYKIDSLGLFGNSNYLSLVAKDLTSGKMVAGLKNYDERYFQELIVKKSTIKNDVIAIGSSKLMQLRKRFFLDQDMNFFNHSVSGASLEDYIAIVGLYESFNDYLPDKIILGIDPWIFNKHNDQNRWKTLSKYYDYEINKIYNEQKDINVNINLIKWKQLFNYDYTIRNINFFKTLLKNNRRAYFVTNTIEIDESIKELDGSIHHPYKDRYPNYEEVKKSAVLSAKKPVYSLESYTTFSDTKIFEDFIKYLLEKKVEIIFFLPPYHPIAYDLLIKNNSYKIIHKVENHLINFSDNHSIKLIGSYNPHKYNLKNEDFIDGMHPNENVIKKIFDYND